MMSSQFLRIQKLTGKTIIYRAARHNLREILAEIGAEQDSHIDPSRTALNRILRGPDTAAKVAGMARSLMAKANLKTIRKDAVLGVEIIFSLPPESPIDTVRFFTDAVQWAERYCKAPILSAVIHNDEAAPHCHVLILPLIDGRMNGSELMGGLAKLCALHAAFYSDVAQHYGLARHVPQKRLSAEIRRQAVELAFRSLQLNSDLNDNVLRTLVEPHLKNPEPLLQQLGLDMPKPKVKGTFVGTMTKPCKKEKHIGFDKNLIGIDEVMTPETRQTLSCVGLAQSAQPIQMPEYRQTAHDCLAPNDFNADEVPQGGAQERGGDAPSNSRDSGDDALGGPPVKVPPCQIGNDVHYAAREGGIDVTSGATLLGRG